MALNAEQKKLMDERRAIDAQVKALKVKAVALRDAYDKLTNRLNLEHKVGRMSPEEKQSIANMLKQ